MTRILRTLAFALMLMPLANAAEAQLAPADAGAFMGSWALMLDTPQNMRRAAFNGEVVDVALHEVPTEAQIAQVRAQPFVLGDVERTGPTGLRIVVDDATTALEEVSRCVTAAGLTIVDASEHVVDYDEAFVRVVERHRNGADGLAGVPWMM